MARSPGKLILELLLSVKQEQMSNLHCRHGVEILCLSGGTPGVPAPQQLHSVTDSSVSALVSALLSPVICSYDCNSQISKALVGLVAAGL